MAIREKNILGAISEFFVRLTTNQYIDGILTFRNDLKIRQTKKLHFVNDSDVNIRKSPEILPDNKVGKFEKGDYVTVRMVTKEKEKIGNKAYPWYYIQGYDKELSGWIYGEYISVNQDYYMDVWAPREVTIKFPKRCFYFNKLIEKSKTYFIDSDNKFILDETKMSNIGETGLWYIKESCPNICTYSTEFGSVRIHYNKDTRTWAPMSYTFTDKTFCDLIGMSKEEMSNRLGTDFCTDDREYEAESCIFYPDYDEWGYSLEIFLTNNIVSKIKVSLNYN